MDPSVKRQFDLPDDLKAQVKEAGRVMREARLAVLHHFEDLSVSDQLGRAWRVSYVDVDEWGYRINWTAPRPNARAWKAQEKIILEMVV